MYKVHFQNVVAMHVLFAYNILFSYMMNNLLNIEWLW